MEKKNGSMSDTRKEEINGSLGRSSVRIAGVVSTLRMSTKRYKTSFSG